MNLTQSNNYAKEFIKQIQASHKHLTLDQIFGIMGWAGMTMMKNQVPPNGKDAYACSICAEFFHVSLLDDAEFEAYKEQVELKKKEIEAAEATPPVVVEEEKKESRIILLN